MPKRVLPLLALCLLLALLSQSACAAPAISSEMFYDQDDVQFPQDPSILTNNKEFIRPDADSYYVRLSRPCDGDIAKQASLKQSFLAHYNDDNAKSLESGYTRKALYLDMTLLDKNGTEKEVFSDSDHQPIPLHPLLPVSAFIPEGTRFKNLTVYHLDSLEGWENREAQLYSGMLAFNQDGELSGNLLDEDFLASSSSNTFVTFTLHHFSPFVIVWDEPPAAAPLSVPQTGDSSSLAAWLLLGGACALALLAKKKSAASA